MRMIHETDAPPTRNVLGAYEAYGCRVNAIDVGTLYQRYQQGGFVYPQKRERIAPFLPQILDNWRRALQGGEELLRVITYEDRAAGRWGSTSLWRTTGGGFQPQHLVSINGPAASRAVILAAQASCIREGLHSQQCWFSPDNRFAAKVFGSMPDAIGEREASLNDWSYVAVSPEMLPGLAPDGRAQVVRCREGVGSGLHDLAVRARGRVYAEAEELGSDDIELLGVNERYQRVGLTRLRTVWLGFSPGNDQAAGAALAYRGPLGINLSLLENRCDLLLNPDLADEEVPPVVAALLGAASQAYLDFAPGFLPVTADRRAAAVLARAGARLMRGYRQLAWLGDGFRAGYDQIERCYRKAMRAAQKHGGPGLAGSGGPARNRPDTLRREAS
jgi:hypothetical protein